MQIKTIKITNLSCVFSRDYGSSLVVLKDINLTFPINKITAIVGPAASGKTVLLKHLNGLLTPTKGTVEIGDYMIKAKQRSIPNIQKIRKNVGFVFEFPEMQLFEETVEKDTIFGPLNFGFKKQQAKANAIKYLQLLGLNESYLERSPFVLSGGERRKVAIAGILAYDPEIILFDQLGIGLDLKAKNKFLDLLLELKTKMQKTIIFTSNDSDDILKIADQVVVLAKGEVVRITSPQELFWDLSFCRQYSILLPSTISFLVSLQKAGFNWKRDDLLFKNETSLINSLVNLFAKKEVKKE